MYGMALEFCAACDDCGKEIVVILPAPSSLSSVGLDGKPSGCCNSSWFEGNIWLVLGTLTIGNDGANLSNFCAFLDTTTPAHLASRPPTR